MNNETFDFWQSPQYEQNKYYATKDEKQIPKRFALGSLIRDYIVSSYSNSPIDPNVFIIPDYCKKQCNGIFPESQNNLMKNYLSYQ